MCSSTPSATALHNHQGSRRNGKIAKLPIEQRDTLNRMLADGATSTAIIEHFRPLKLDLNPTNITNWKEGGFQDWLRHQEALHELHNDGELAALLGTGTDETAFHKGVLRLAMTKLFKALRTNQLDEDPANYNRLLTNLARLSRESLALRKHLDSVSGVSATPAGRRVLDPNGPLTEEERTAILDKLDQIMGFTTKKTTPPPSALSSDSTQKPPELKPIQGDLSQPIEIPPAPEFTHKNGGIDFIGADAPHTSPEEKAFLRSFCAPIDSEQIPAPGLPTNAASRAPSSEKSAIEQTPAPTTDPSAETTAPTNETQPSESEPLSALEVHPSSLTESVVENHSDSLCASASSRPCGEPSGSASESDSDKFIHSDLQNCYRCKAELPPLLPNGERPDQFCPKCRTSLRHPATLKFYCPKCRNSVRDLWFDEETKRSSDTCPHCLEDLPPVDLLNKSWPPKPPVLSDQNAQPQSAHAE